MQESKKRGRPRKFDESEAMTSLGSVNLPAEELELLRLLSKEKFGGQGVYDYGNGKFNFGLWIRDVARVAVGLTEVDTGREIDEEMYVQNPQDDVNHGAHEIRERHSRGSPSKLQETRAPHGLTPARTCGSNMEDAAAELSDIMEQGAGAPALYLTLERLIERTKGSASSTEDRLADIQSTAVEIYDLIDRGAGTPEVCSVLKGFVARSRIVR